LHAAAVVHVWFVHTCDDVWQFAHAAPLLPHAVFEVPATHVFPEQHPAGHVAGLHGGGAEHAWFVHTSAKLMQFAHAVPPDPHAVFCVPMRQMLPEQHPDAQLAGLQETGTVHTPPMHVSLTGQGEHGFPIAPHCAGVLPG
jgi:hypothetical protein